MNSSNSNRFNPSQSSMKKTGLSGKNVNEDAYMGTNIGINKLTIKVRWDKAQKTSERILLMLLV